MWIIQLRPLSQKQTGTRDWQYLHTKWGQWWWWRRWWVWRCALLAVNPKCERSTHTHTTPDTHQFEVMVIFDFSLFHCCSQCRDYARNAPNREELRWRWWRWRMQTTKSMLWSLVMGRKLSKQVNLVMFWEREREREREREMGNEPLSRYDSFGIMIFGRGEGGRRWWCESIGPVCAKRRLSHFKLIVGERRHHSKSNLPNLIITKEVSCVSMSVSRNKPTKWRDYGIFQTQQERLGMQITAGIKWCVTRESMRRITTLVWPMMLH